MRYKQLNLFGGDNINTEPYIGENKAEVEEPLVSAAIKESLEIYDIPFLGCDFSDVYPSVLSVIPKENVIFDMFGEETAIMCEVICCAMCHQINWDFLRLVILKTTRENKEWLSPKNLLTVDKGQVYEMLRDYHKKENIKAEERAAIIRKVGVWAKRYGRISTVFVDDKGNLKPIEQVLSSLKLCSVFSTDPEGKKLNLLLQKLDMYSLCHGIGSYAKPAIDYHLIRLYLRRGLLYARTKYALDYLNNPEVERKENTVAAVREHCSLLLKQISAYTGCSIASVNLIEWHVARSVCTREQPDFQLLSERAKWLKPQFCKCPFYETCSAKQNTSETLLNLIEPNYKGTSY